MILMFTQKTKITPVGKPLLNKDLEGKPCKKD
jgi:hypothetical protein